MKGNRIKSRKKFRRAEFIGEYIFMPAVVILPYFAFFFMWLFIGY